MEKRVLNADEETKGNEHQTSVQNGGIHVDPHRSGNRDLAAVMKLRGTKWKASVSTPYRSDRGDWSKQQSSCGSSREKAASRQGISHTGGLSRRARGFSVVTCRLSEVATRWRGDAKAVTVGAAVAGKHPGRILPAKSVAVAGDQSWAERESFLEPSRKFAGQSGRDAQQSAKEWGAGDTHLLKGQGRNRKREKEHQRETFATYKMSWNVTWKRIFQLVCLKQAFQTGRTVFSFPALGQCLLPNNEMLKSQFWTQR